MQVFNRGSLGIFLVANLVVEAVNLSIPTLDANTPHAMAILIVYAAVLTCVALGMDN